MSRLLTNHRLPDNVACLFTENNVWSKKWILCCSYNPLNISNHMWSRAAITKFIENYL